MKVSFTEIVTDTFTVSSDGKTVGQMVNEWIANTMKEGNVQAKSVSIEITEQDLIALRLLQAPVRDDDGALCADYTAAERAEAYKPKTKPSYKSASRTFDDNTN